MSRRQPSPTSDIDEAIAELRSLAAAHPSIAPWANTLAACMPVLFAPSRGAVLSPELTVGQAATAMAEGVPLLRGRRVNFDLTSLRRALATLGEAIAAGPSQPTARDTADRLANEQEIVASWLDQVLSGRAAEGEAELARRGLDPPLATALLRLAVFPQLAALAECLDGHRAGGTWSHGTCPTCGSRPILAETRGLEQLRFLRCGLCATSWQFPRMACPFCGQRDARGMSFFQVAEQAARWRVVVCDACGGYLKTITTLAALRPAQLLVQEVASLRLDVAATYWSG